MELTSAPISATQRSKLLSAGYTSLSSLASVSSSDLAREIDVSESEATEILKNVSSPRTSLITGALSAWDKHRKESSCPSITTFSTDLDNILGGGIACKQVTEFGGAPGIGKTQLGIQLAINVQIPVSYDGLGGKAIYIDTEGSFMVERVLQIAEACIQDIPEHYRFHHKVSPRCKVEMLPGNMLENIFHFRVCSYTEQIAVINYLDKFVSEHRDVKILIIDSITFHFRQDFDDLALRTRLLSGMALKLMNLAKKFNIAVVVLNQVTTKFAEGSFQLTLALGDSWSHSSTNRVILYWNGDERFAYLDKSPSCRSASTAYSVTSRGIRNSTSSYKRPKMR